MFPTSSALMADALGMPQAAAYDLLAGCTGFMYAVAQAYGMLAAGLSRRALVVGGDVLSKILDWDDRSTLVLFGDGAGAVVLEPVSRGGFLGFELGATANDARAVDDMIQPGPAFHDGADGRTVAHVETPESDFRHCLFCALDLAIGRAGRQHICAEHRERFGDGCADAGGAAGNQHAPAGEQVRTERRQRAFGVNG